jgi:diguanylate cyclase (GGDEF)-like protein
MYSFSLRFKHDDLELAFMDATLARTRLQGQVAILVGMFVYLLHGGLDQWFVAADQARQVWLVRLTAMCVPLLVLLISFSRHFSRIRHLLLALVGLAAGVGLLGMQIALPLESAPYFYPMMVLVTFYTYNFIGTRFIYAFCIDLLLLLLYNLLFGWLLHYPPHVLLGHDFFIISANLIGGAAGYLNERQRRLLFLRERELDDERQQHLARALHDGLTGLPNRELLYDRIGQAIESAHRDGARHCGYFLDLDGFKAVNDRFGHKMGDHVLREVARRLNDSVRGMDTVARIGGDEFFVLAVNIVSENEARALAQKLLDAVAATLPGVPQGLEIGTSIGLCLFPYDNMSAADIIHRADQAMYRIKTSGKGRFALADDVDEPDDERGMLGTA